MIFRIKVEVESIKTKAERRVLILDTDYFKKDKRKKKHPEDNGVHTIKV